MTTALEIDIEIGRSLQRQVVAIDQNYRAALKRVDQPTLTELRIAVEEFTTAIPILYDGLAEGLRTFGNAIGRALITVGESMVNEPCGCWQTLIDGSEPSPCTTHPYVQEGHRNAAVDSQPPLLGPRHRSRRKGGRDEVR